MRSGGRGGGRGHARIVGTVTGRTTHRPTRPTGGIWPVTLDRCEGCGRWWLSLLRGRDGGLADGRRAAAATRRRSVPCPAQTEGLTVDATTTYRLDPGAGVVAVTVEAVLTNELPSRRGARTSRRRTSAPSASPRLGPVTASGPPGTVVSLSTTVEQDEGGVEFVIVDLSPNLVHGSPQSIVVQYDLPGPAEPFGVGQPDQRRVRLLVRRRRPAPDGLADVVVDVPERFEMDFTDVPGPTPEPADGRAVYRIEGLGEDESFFGVSARDDDRLVTGRPRWTTTGSRSRRGPTTSRGPGSPTDAVERGVPALAELVGSELDGEREVTIAETATPYLYGYAGWYVAHLDLIEIGDELDLQAMLHELSHLWFNGQLFETRWINEGLAEHASPLGRRRARRRPGPRPGRRWFDTGCPATQPVGDAGRRRRHRDGRGLRLRRLYAVIDAVAAEIGDDGLRALARPRREESDRLRRRSRSGANVGAAPTGVTSTTSPNGWPGRSEIGAVLDRYVLTEDDRAQVAGRAAAIERYDGARRGRMRLDAPARDPAAHGRLAVQRGRPRPSRGPGDLDGVNGWPRLDPLDLPVPAGARAGYESAVDIDDVVELEHALLDPPTTWPPSTTPCPRSDRSAGGPGRHRA